MKIVATVGLPSSGRTTVANVAKEYNLPVFTKTLEGISLKEKSVIDGLEKDVFEELKGIGRFYLIALLTPVKKRYEFSSKLVPFKKFVNRDKRLLDNGLDRLISLADHNIVNKGNIEDLKFEARRAFSKVFNFEKVFVWTSKKERRKTIDLLSELFPKSEIYEGKNRILALTDFPGKFEEIISELRDPLLKYFEIKGKITHVIGENVLKFGLSKKELLNGRLELATSLENNLKIVIPVQDTIMIELITKDPKKLLENL